MTLSLVNKLDVILFSSWCPIEIQQGIFQYKPCIVLMDYQSSTAINSIMIPPFFNPFQYFSSIIAGVKFGTLWQHLNNMKSVHIPCDRYHQFGWTNYGLLSFEDNFSTREPNHLMTCRETEPRFIKGNDIML
jgi:hypothetical protein